MKGKKNFAFSSQRKYLFAFLPKIIEENLCFFSLPKGRMKKEKNYEGEMKRKETHAGFIEAMMMIFTRKNNKQKINVE
jgi:hypothetical protein